MEIALFLHLYQPPTQFPEVTDIVVRESYEPLFSILENSPQAHITVNISASLTEQLTANHWEVLAKFRKLADKHQIEVVGTAAYHPILTKLPDAEVYRQVKINEEINNRIWQLTNQRFGHDVKVDDSKVKGFFPPEMAIGSNVALSAKKLGYSYIIVDESVLDEPHKHVFSDDHIFTDRFSGIKVVVRHRRVSLDIAYSRIRSVSELVASFSDNGNCPYLILAMDGETFGHHRPEQLEFLKTLFNSSSSMSSGGSLLQLVTLSELLSHNSSSKVIDLQESSWAESFDRWANPNNPIHKSQWALLNCVISAVSNYPERDANFWKARSLLDKGVQSDQFWWSSHNPCWHYKMVQRGALLLLEAISELEDANDLIKSGKVEAERLYNDITQTGLHLYGDTVIAC